MQRYIAQRWWNLYPWRFSRLKCGPTSRGRLDHLAPGIPSNQYLYDSVKSVGFKQQK